MPWDFEPAKKGERIHCQSCGESADVPPGMAAVWHRCKARTTLDEGGQG